MKVHSKNTKCETNMSGATAFSIQASAKMFKILSSGLYSNKERAIIREVSCNAYDANVDAGNGDVPIEVHLPNYLEPFFSIKDSGTGLTPDQMVNIYTQYGNSTKTDRNDQIGALGLGSKSPFSYIDSFTVISITEGTKNTYSCYIDGEGSPQLQPFGSVETDEANSIEVTFPVKKTDFDKFRAEAEIVFRPFEVKPNVVGNKDYKVKDFDVIVTSNTADWQLVEPIKTSHYDRQYIRVAVQGNIEYPININIIKEHLLDIAYRIIHENYRLHFDIGELDIAASREELGYDETTIQNIVNKFEKMATEIVAAQNDKIDKFKTRYEAMQYISELKNSTNIYNNFEFSYKNKPISNFMKVIDNFEVIKYTRNMRGGIGRSSMINSYDNTIIIPRKNQDTIWLLNDNNKKSQSVSKARSLVTHNNTVYLVQSKAFLDVIGNPEYQNASEIDNPLTKSKSSTGKFFKKFYNSNNMSSQWYGSFDSADNVGLDVEKEFFYIPLKGRTPGSYTNIYGMKRVAEEFGLIAENTEVFGVSASHCNTKKFSNYKGIEFVEFIKNKLKKSKRLINELKAFGELETKNKIDTMDGMFAELVKDKNFCDSLPTNNLFREIHKDYNDITIKDKDFLYILKGVATKLEIKIPSSDYKKDKEAEALYPLITNIGWRVEKEHIIEYINGVDLLKKLATEKEANETTKKDVLENTPEIKIIKENI